MSVSKRDKSAQQLNDENFLRRWSRRKHETEQNPVTPSEGAAAPDVTSEKPVLTVVDMPAIDSLTEDSDYSGFFSPKVSESLRKQALRKLFQSPMFNIRDGLDDYDGVYTEFEKLGDIVTADMRHQLEMEAERHAQQMLDDESDKHDEPLEVAIATTTDDEMYATIAGQENVDTEQAIDAVDETEIES